MIRAVQHDLARSYCWTMAALETGVEQKADLVLLQEPLEDRGGIEISHSAHEIRKQMTVWTAVCKRSGLATDQQPHLSRGANNDLVVTDVQRRREKMTGMINIYDQNAVRTEDRQERKINWCGIIRQRGGTIPAGELNEHSCR